MKSSLPLAVKPKRLVHSRVIPAWKDAFDLRTYFACIDPGQYELKREGELGPAQQVFGVVQEFSVKWVALYRAIVRALPNREEVLDPAMTCLESLLGSDRASHLSWYESPQTDFGGKAPEYWFIDRGLVELAHCLRFYVTVKQSELNPDVPLQTKTGHDMSVVVLRQTASEGERLLNSNQLSLLRIVRSLFSPDEWEDEFDLAPYFAAWSPLLHLQATPSTVRSVLPIYDLVTAQIAGMIRVYRTALEVACRRSGVLEGVARCMLKVATVGQPPYTAWYHAPQAEFFNGISPRSWFQKNDAEELGNLLSLSSSPKDQANA